MDFRVDPADIAFREEVRAFLKDHLPDGDIVELTIPAE